MFFCDKYKLASHRYLINNTQQHYFAYVYCHNMQLTWYIFTSGASDFKTSQMRKLIARANLFILKY